MLHTLICQGLDDHFATCHLARHRRLLRAVHHIKPTLPDGREDRGGNRVRREETQPKSVENVFRKPISFHIKQINTIPRNHIASKPC